MARKPYIRRKSKYEDEAILYETEIIKIEFLNQEVKERWKSVFYAKSAVNPEGRMCIYWGNCKMEEGDKVAMKGRMKDGVFLCWNYQIHHKATEKTEENV